MAKRFAASRSGTLLPVSQPLKAEISVPWGVLSSERRIARGDSAMIRARRPRVRLDIKAVTHALQIGIPGNITVICVSLDLLCALQNLWVGRRDAENRSARSVRTIPITWRMSVRLPKA